MGGKVGDWVVTATRGMALEINALWYNALSMLGLFLLELGRKEESPMYRAKAMKVRESFSKIFWNEAKGSLYDFVDGDIRSDDLRPNQIYAVSLPFPLLAKDRAKQVFDAITENLLTPKGLPSLAAMHRDYKPT